MTLRDVLKRLPVAYRAARAVRLASGRLLPPRRVRGVPGPVHRNDLMLASTASSAVDSYVTLGRSAVDAMGAAMRAAGAGDIDAAHEILDLGSGHGRVLRFLRERLPDASITACDLDPDAVAFCERAFGAHGLLSSEDFDAIDFGRYDLVWMGSVVTHLPRPRWRQLTSVLARVVQPGGVATFSSHGERAQGQLDHYGPGLEARRQEIMSQLESTGHAYAPYQHYSGATYGVAFHTTAEIDAAMGDAFERVLFEPAGWGGHQDLHGFVRRRSA